MTQDPLPACSCTTCIHHAPEPFDMAPEDAFCLLLHRRTLDSQTCEKHEELDTGQPFPQGVAGPGEGE